MSSLSSLDESWQTLLSILKGNPMWKPFLDNHELLSHLRDDLPQLNPENGGKIWAVGTCPEYMQTGNCINFSKCKNKKFHWQHLDRYRADCQYKSLLIRNIIDVIRKMAEKPDDENEALESLSVLLSQMLEVAKIEDLAKSRGTSGGASGGTSGGASATDDSEL